MKIGTKLISTLLAVLMLCGSLTGLFTINAFAAEEVTTSTPSGTTAPDEEEEVDYTTIVYATPDEKLATMKPMTSKAGYQLFVKEGTGEVAIKNLTTGQILFTNPYDVATSKGSAETKMEIMSQIIVNYVDNGSQKTFTSYEMAALRDQIKVKNIKNGIRVEYTIGREEARRLVPRLIEKSDFEREIMTPMLEYYDNNPQNFWYKKFMAYYQYKSLADCDGNAQLEAALKKNFPIVEKYDVYVFDPTASTHELEEREEQIKTACPNYSYEEMDANHQKTEYQGADKNPPVFKMALEYTIGDDGAISVRLPANGLRFNESLYQLNNISILPYMGAGNSTYDGYTFYPDGSGALFTFEDLDLSTTTTVSGKVYGVDYAYHKISGTYQESIRYPVFGVKEDTVYYDITLYDDTLGEETVVRIDGAIYEKIMSLREALAPIPEDYKAYENYISLATDIKQVSVSRGYVGILEEGDAMADIATYHAGAKSDYNTINMLFNPRPKDSYNLADAISVGTNTEWTVVSSRKYVGNYKIRYVMLTDKNIAEEKSIPATDYYDTTWLGMAFAYRDHLIDSGVLTELSEDKTNGDIPLYIEAFGAIETTEKIMSIPVEVMKPLTSFADVITMYEQLVEKNVSNINFKLTGFANGGMYSNMPTDIKWEKAVSKEKKFQELLNYAANVKDGKLGIYPDFELSYVAVNELFDAVILSKHAVKTIDDRYTVKRVYSATQQRYMGYGDLAISPAYFSVFYEKLVKNYTKYENITGMSVASLGNALNSDFDDDDPYNREDSKGFVVKALEYLSSEDNGNMEIMVEGGNAYTWKYVDHILGVSLDSSRYIQASYSVPFIGVVLHGYMNFADTPLNMEGDINYSLLKAIENGASIYFTLSYDNTEILKDDVQLSKYYSIRYDIWFDDVVEIYNELNNATKDVQDKFIMGHEFLSGVRVPDTDELMGDIIAEFNGVLDYQNNKAEYEQKSKNEAISDARELIATVQDVAKDFISECLDYYSGQRGSAYNYRNEFDTVFSAYLEANSAYEQIKAAYDSANGDAKAALEAEYLAAEKLSQSTFTKLKNCVKNVSNYIYNLEKAKENLDRLYEDAKSGELLISESGCPQSILDEIEAQIENIEELMNEQLGINLLYSVEKLAVDTFLQTHVSMLINRAAAGHGIKDATACYYEMLESGKYGLTQDEIGLLRYLDANKTLTDAEIIAKYNITEDGSNYDGVVLYVRELLGNVVGQSEDVKYEFDPALSDAEVDQDIINYFHYMLYYKVTHLKDDTTLPALNFVQTIVNENNEIVANTANIYAVTKSIQEAIAGDKKGFKNIITSIKNGESFTLEDAAIQSKINSLVDECKKIISSAKGEKEVKYATPDTLEQDLRSYIVAYFYKLLIENVYKQTSDASLHLMTKNYDVMTSIEMFYNNNYAAEISRLNTADLKKTMYKTIFELVMTDARTSEYIDTVADMLVNGYGDVKEQIRTNLLIMIANGLSSANVNEPGFGFDRDNNPPADEAALLNQAREIIFERVASISLADAATSTAAFEAIIAEIYDMFDDYGYRETRNLTDDVTNFVYYTYYSNYITFYKNKDTVNYFYDSMIGKVDSQIGAVVESQIAYISALGLGNVSDFELLDIIFEMLADEDLDIVDVMTEYSKTIEYYPTRKGNLANDTLSYYCHALISYYGLERLSKVDNPMTKKADKNVIDKNIDSKITVLVKLAKNGAASGCLPNYALNNLMTDAELEAFVEEIIVALRANLAEVPDDAAELATLKENLKEYFKYKYYTAVIERLGAQKKVSFSVADVYGEPLYIETNKLKNMMRYYVTNFTPLTEQDIEDMIRKGTTIIEDDEDTYSKYLSDDGKIVSVTYGTRNVDGSYTPYKTFLLNYNNFSVRVEYNGTYYNISSYGFLTVMH